MSKPSSLPSPSIPRSRGLLGSALGSVAASTLLVVLADGYRLGGPLVRVLTDAVLLCSLFLLAATDMADLVRRLDRRNELRRQAPRWGSLGLLLVLALVGVDLEVMRWLVVVRQWAAGLHLLMATALGKALAEGVGRSPARLMASSFLLLIAVGTLMLTFPAATRDGLGASLLDALFTATSATCVTGLAVQDTGTYFTPFGQLTILLLIQTGGLGIMTLSGAAALLLGRRLGLRSRSLLSDALEMPDATALQSLVGYIVKMTLLIEGCGALLLFVRFYALMPVEEAAYNAIFHAISAFCNAGFSTWSDSLTRFRGDLLVNLVVSLLIIAGGLGFTVIAELQRGRQRRPRRSLQLRVVMLMTLGLILLGAVAHYFFDYNATLAGLPLDEKVLAALFSSVSARTAGFNTVDFAGLSHPAILMLLVLMYIGAAPGGTAGGIKITTVAVLTLSIRAMLTGRAEVELFDRAVPQPVVYKSVAIAAVSLLLIVALLVPLLATEAAAFEVVLFEAVSAFGTVGLSMGLTPHLTVAGKLLIIVLMFAGRTGPLTLALAIGERPPGARYTLPSETIMVG